MEHRFSFPFDVDLIRAGLRRDFTDKWFWSLGLLVVMLLAAWLWTRSFPWPLLVATLVVAPVLRWRIGKVLEKTAARIDELWTQQSPSRTIRVQVDEEAIEMHLEQGRSRHPWAGMRRLWCLEGLWLFELAGKHTLFLPADAMNAEQQAFVLERCQQAGVRVKREAA